MFPDCKFSLYVRPQTGHSFNISDNHADMFIGLRNPQEIILASLAI